MSNEANDEDDELAKALALSSQLADARIKDDQENHPNLLGDRLIKACETGNVAEVKALLLAGASPNVVREAGTPAGLAIYAPQPIEILKLLITASADLSLQDRNGWNPLFIATGNDYVEIIRFLVSSGSNINAQCLSNGWTPLMNAASFGYVKSVVELLALGADVTLKSEDGLTAIQIAKANCQGRVLQVFGRYLEILSSKNK